MRSFQMVSMMRILGSFMARTRASVWSLPWPMAITNSSTSGSKERMEASNGKPSSTPLRMKVKPLMEMVMVEKAGSLKEVEARIFARSKI